MVDNSTIACLFGIGAVIFAAQYFMEKEPRRARRRAVSESLIDEVAAVVPQASRDVIRADLEQTQSANVSITRLLDASTRGELPVAAESAPIGTTSSSSGASNGSSLLGKYKLTGDESVPEASSGWKSSRAERESQLKAQREAMVLRARQKLSQKSE